MEHVVGRVGTPTKTDVKPVILDGLELDTKKINMARN